MKNIQPTKTYRRWVNVFAPLFAACFLLLLPGCRNLLEPPEVAETRTGTLSLTISGHGVARTITPESWPNDFVEFVVKLIAGGDAEPTYTIPLTDHSSTVELSAGTWDLRITAYRDNGNGQATRPAATYSREGIEVSPGATVRVDATLFPIAEGSGTFRWNINLHEDLVIATVGIEIMRVDGSGVPYAEPYWEGFLEIAEDGTLTGYRELPSGRYLVVFTLTNEVGERAAINAILHVYQNMESVFVETFTEDHFLVSLLDSVLAAWDGSSWDFARAGITAGHFPLLNIVGINTDNFVAIIDQFDDLTSPDTAPTDIEGLKALVDAALIGMARGSLAASDHENRTYVEAAIAALVANGSAITFRWTGFDTVTVGIGVYEVVIVFHNDVSLPPVPGDTLVEQLAWLRTHAQGGNDYLLEIRDDEEITPAQAALPTGMNNLTVILRGRGAMRTVNLSANGSLFVVGTGVTFVLGENITLMGRGPNAIPASESNNNPLVQVNGTGTLIMSAGSRITGNTAHSPSFLNVIQGSGVRVNTGGTFTMNGGEISRNTTTGGETFGVHFSGAGGGVHVANGGMFNMHGGTISENTGRSGGGVILVGGTFNMHGGEIHSNTAGADDGGGVANNGTFNMHGGKIFDNTTAELGGGVSVGQGGVFAMHDGEISGNTASLGGGVGNTGTSNMHGGKIFNNIASSGAGGIMNGLNGIFNMHDGKVSGNTATGAFGGGGVRNEGSAIFRISNGIIYGDDADAELANTTTLSIGATLINTITATAQHGTFSNGDFTEIGTLNTTNNTIHVVNGILQVPERTGNLAEQLAWLRYWVQTDGPYTIELNGDESITPDQGVLSTGRSDLTIIIRGRDVRRTISLSDNGNLFAVGSGVTLVLDENITLAGRDDNNNSLIQIGSGGTLIMDEGSMVTGNVNTSSWPNAGGGVRIDFGGRFYMKGGEISANITSATSSGGGVHVIGGGATFVMKGGEIFGNKADGGSSGGGVHVDSNASFIMENGKITGNEVTSLSSGGGVRINSTGSTFTMKNGKISDNEAAASGSGGGVHVSANATFAMEGGEITGNQTSGGWSGGGVNVANATFVMKSGEITDNSAWVGGGVNIDFGGTFIMANGEISGNTATSTGGGVNIINSTFSMTGGVIFGNEAILTGLGGGVNAIGAASTFTMEGGEIYGNIASSGGGVRITLDATFEMSNGIIHGADAEAGRENIATGGNGAALLNFATAQHGTFNGAFVPSGDLSTTNYTIHVIGGVLQP